MRLLKATEIAFDSISAVVNTYGIRAILIEKCVYIYFTQKV